VGLERLPTEAEWEFAARGGLGGKKYVWGDESFSERAAECNTFQGHFPHEHGQGRVRTHVAVKAFPADGYGLYDMAGTSGSGCDDWFLPTTTPSRRREAVVTEGPDHSFDLAAAAARRVHRGGSFFCCVGYCFNYRTAPEWAVRRTPACHT